MTRSVPGDLADKAQEAIGGSSTEVDPSGKDQEVAHCYGDGCGDARDHHN